LPLHPSKVSFIPNLLPTLCCFHSLKIRETNLFILALIKKSLSLSYCEFMEYTFPSLTSLIFFLLLKYVISHIQLSNSQNDYTYIQCRNIFNHFINKVLLDGDLQSRLLIHFNSSSSLTYPKDYGCCNISNPQFQFHILTYLVERLWLL